MIVFSRTQLTAMREQAETTYPEECCGLIAGWVDGDTIRATEVEPSPNVAPANRRSRFEVDPQIRFNLMRRLRGTGNRIVGHYHSHPDDAAVPSDRDLSRALEPDLIWVLIGTKKDTVTEVRAYRANRNATAFMEIPLSFNTKTA